MRTPTAQYMYTEGELVVCELCPHQCRIDPEESGICGVRAHRAGAPSLPYYSFVARIDATPVEHLPLYHFHPGKRLLHVSLVGSPLAVSPFAEWSVASAATENAISITPEEVVDNAIESEANGIVFGGGEPALHVEYIREVAAKAHAQSLTLSCRSSGFIERESAAGLAEALDAILIELPFTQIPPNAPSQPDSEHAVDSAAVLAAVETLLETDLHVEIALRPDPEREPDLDGVRRLLRRLGDLSAHMPIHVFSSDEIADVARQHMDSVYGPSGNGDTTCPVCDRLLVQRGEVVSVPGIRRGRCRSCGGVVPGRFQSA